VSDAPAVTVVGGGLAGMTAALRLGERGYRVKLYEQKSMLGGNIASRTLANGGQLDVYPHMFLGWYQNFWQMLEDIGVERSENFVRFTNVRQLARDEFPRFTELINGYEASDILANLKSGVAPPADMFLFGYAGVDLLAEQLNPTVRMHEMSLSGFLSSRPYITKGAIDAYETFVTRVWAIPSYLVSVKEFRTYLAYCFAEADSLSWLARGPAAAAVIRPLEVALERAGVAIERLTTVTEVVRADDRVSEIVLQHADFNPRTYMWETTGEPWTEAIDELVLAVPGPTLSRLVHGGEPGRRIVEAAPRLAELSRLRTQRVPILNLCFKGKLAGLPPEPVGLLDSRLSLAFTDISQAWSDAGQFGDRTVCAVSCSDPYGLMGLQAPENGHQMLLELASYLDFDPGERWGDSPAIDWSWTRYHENWDAQLSLNAIGTDAWRPAPICEGVSNLSFAGDFCSHHVGLTTIESAVTSGLEAVNAIVDRRGLGAEAEVLQPPTLPDSTWIALRYGLAPYALGAKAWASATRHVLADRSPEGSAKDESVLRYLLTPGLPARRHRRES
jgi:Flavin containing amine oxidoreductase